MARDPEYAFAVVSQRLEFFQAWHSVLCRMGTVRHENRVEALGSALPGKPVSLYVVDARVANPLSPSLVAQWVRNWDGARLLLGDTALEPIDELSILASGALGCCDVSLRREELPGIVGVVLRSSVWVSKAAVPLLITKLQTAETSATTDSAASPGRQSECLHTLTERQRQVATMVAHGASNKQIARALAITDRTVKFHMSGIFDRLGVGDRLSLALRMAGASY